MPDKPKSHDYLVISRGQWDRDATPEQIQDAIDRFYAWYEDHVFEGTMKAGSRLAAESKLVTRDRTIDGPYSEAKEIIGGYWWIVAGSLEEAATVAAGNPCIALGLAFELRPLDAERASAVMTASETPARD